MTKTPETPTEERKVQEYEKPEVRTEEVFETLAITCTKATIGCQPTPGVPTLQS